ncbi:MAG: arginase family protein [Thermoanaerobaculia bacterium]
MTDRYLLSPFFLDRAVPELETLAGDGWTVNRPPLPDRGTADGETRTRMSVYHRSLADLVSAAVAAGERPISIADCCGTLAMTAGLRRGGLDPALLWLDAHGDFNTFETSPSGFLGGMPLAMLTGRGDQAMMRALDLEPFREDRIVLTDARNLDPGERQALESSAILHLEDPRDLLSRQLPEGPLYVHFDVDVVDPADAPAMGYPEPGGLRAGEIQEIFRQLASVREIVAVSLSPWKPDRDGADRTRRTAMDLLRTLLTPGTATR